MTLKELKELTKLKERIDNAHRLMIALAEAEGASGSLVSYRDYAVAISNSLEPIMEHKLGSIEPGLGKILADTFNTYKTGLENYRKRLEIELASITITKPEDFHG